ncbi:hypothetical protein E2C01_026874 [Portunus trituberculatus]|uniref:Uncharacterized protein n=1 Tax=Portunus trituberculatus TaxID=210409 RepID=A0A5B7EGN4_PORTR|nr:hypothetical protein [Portunus trituberculatus]
MLTSPQHELNLQYPSSFATLQVNTSTTTDVRAERIPHCEFGISRHFRLFKCHQYKDGFPYYKDNA